VWTPPYEVEIAHLLRVGRNEIMVIVGNLPANRFLGLPDEDLEPLRSVYGNRFPAPEEKALMPEPPRAGLIGKVWLTVLG